jgi:hypothetical protein
VQSTGIATSDAANEISGGEVGEIPGREEEYYLSDISER